MSAAVVQDLPTPDLAVVRQFLAQTVAEHIHIMAIAPDGQPLPYGRNFGTDAAGAAAWAMEQNVKGYGVYWTVNIVRPGVNKKPAKSDIAAARFLHVDIDPPEDGSFFDRDAVLEALADSDYPPSFVLNSGGGIGAFWRLEYLAEHLTAVEDLNRRISAQFGGDHCHNIDRLMRVPGLVNYPNALKRSRGRVPALSEVMIDDRGEMVDPSYMQEMLPPAPPSKELREKVRIEGIVPLSLAALGIDSTNRLMMMIMQPRHPDRSKATYAVVCEMVRQSFTDAEIAGILLNPDLPISGHCLDQTSPTRAVARVLGQARPDAQPAGNEQPVSRPRGADTPPPKAATEVAEVSEDAIALAFTEAYRETLRFDHDVGRWFRWDGVSWKRDGTDLAMHYTRQFARDLSEAKRALCKASVASGAERFARADRAHAVTNEIWDADPFLLGTPGGTVDLRTGEMSDAIPDQYISKQTAITPEHGPPILWLKFLREAMDGDEAMVTFLQQWCGYCLTGDTREHALAFAYGDGGNGKGVFMNTLIGIMGDYAVTAGMETFTASKHDRHSTELAMLRGARLVTASETEEGRAWAESKIKAITGGDPITARFMRQDNFTFIPQFKLTIAGNHAPTLRNVDDAMRRRFNIIPFTTKPQKPDRELQIKLQAEWGQILAWAIRGCRDWMTNGLTRPSAVLAATKEYFADQDLAGQWFEERCVLTPGRFDTCAKFYADWVTFAKEHGEEPGSNKSFGQMMRRRGFVSELMRSSGIVGKVYKNIALLLREHDDAY